jgi:hypothetical protein
VRQAPLEPWVGRRVEIVGLGLRRLVGPPVGLPPRRVYVGQGAGWWDANGFAHSHHECYTFVRP